MLIGYARVSTDDQRLDLQRDALVKAGVEPRMIYAEEVSGVKTNRPRLEECLRTCRPGDTLVVWRLDRLGRSLPELIKLLDELREREVGFRSLNESIDTTSAVGVMVFHMLAAVAQFERDLISERTKAGLKAARARGRRGGRRPKLGAKQVRIAKTLLADQCVTHEDVAKTLGVSRATLYRAIARDRQAAKVIELAKMKKANRKSA